MNKYSILNQNFFPFYTKIQTKLTASIKMEHQRNYNEQLATPFLDYQIYLGYKEISSQPGSYIRLRYAGSSQVIPIITGHHVYLVDLEERAPTCNPKITGLSLCKRKLRIWPPRVRGQKEDQGLARRQKKRRETNETKVLKMAFVVDEKAEKIYEKEKKKIPASLG